MINGCIVTIGKCMHVHGYMIFKLIIDLIAYNNSQTHSQLASYPTTPCTHACVTCMHDAKIIDDCIAILQLQLSMQLHSKHLTINVIAMAVFVNIQLQLTSYRSKAPQQLASYTMQANVNDNFYTASQLQVQLVVFVHECYSYTFHQHHGVDGRYSQLHSF